MPHRPLLSLVALFALLFGFGTAALAQSPKTEVATFGSGCFWCTESDFDKVSGVVATTSGYMGGDSANATYEKVSRGGTGHYEVVQVTYDPSKVSYQALLDHYWRTTDVVDGGGQFCDRGSHYKPVIFTHTEEQARLAAAGKAALTAVKRFDRPIAVEIIAAKPFTAAEDYHQDFYKKNPAHYQRYRTGCGRDARLKALWGADAGH